MNRIADEIEKMEAIQKRLQPYFSKEVLNSRSYRKEKLADINNILSRYKSSSLSREEKFLRRMLLEERKKIERSLYPNRYLRLARSLLKLGVAVVLFPVRAGERTARHLNFQSELKRYNLSHLSGKPSPVLNSEARDMGETRLSVTGKELQYKYHFEDTPAGPRLSSYTIGMAKEGTKSIRVNIDISKGILNADKAGNLLEGRPVRTEKGIWLAIDTNDKDNKGNFKVKAVPIDVDSILVDLRGRRRSISKDYDIMHKLENGEPLSIKIRGEQRAVSWDKATKRFSVSSSEEKEIVVDQKKKRLVSFNSTEITEPAKLKRGIKLK